MMVFLHPDAAAKANALQAACAELFYDIPDRRLGRASIGQSLFTGQKSVEHPIGPDERTTHPTTPRKRQQPVLLGGDVVTAIRIKLKKFSNHVERTIFDQEITRLESEVNTRGEAFGSRLASVFRDEMSKLEKFEQNQLTESKFKQLVTRIMEMANDG